MSTDPSQAIPAVKAMCQDWAEIVPLMGGTRAMRAAGRRLLPQYPAEDDDAYAARLALSTLLPAYSETVGAMSSRVFAEPLQLGDDVPDGLSSMLEDADLAGNDLNSWAVEFFRHGLAYGLCHAWVDVPRNEGVRTRAEEKAAGVRPYLVLVKPDQVLGWRFQGTRLTQVRYRESIEEADGEFGTCSVEQVRILEPGRWRVYRRDANGDGWALHEKGDTSLAAIPWVTFYTGRTAPMCARPPLIELAHLNIKHWQSQSDQDNLLHIARVPLLFVFTDDDMFQLVISAGRATRMPRDGDAKFVEHSGAAINAGRQALVDLVDEMRMVGAKLLQHDKQPNKTAAQANEEAAQELSPLARMAHHFADCLAQLLQHMADYAQLDEGGHVEMRGNFEQDFAPEVSLPFLLNMATTGKLSDETLFNEAQRRGVISDELNWGDERERIGDQGPPSGEL